MAVQGGEEVGAGFCGRDVDVRDVSQVFGFEGNMLARGCHITAIRFVSHVV